MKEPLVILKHRRHEPDALWKDKDIIGARTQMKTRFLHVMLGIVFGAAMGWLLQQGSVKIDSAIVLKWMLALGVFLLDLSSMLCHHTCKQPPNRDTFLLWTGDECILLGTLYCSDEFDGSSTGEVVHIPAPLRNQYRISCLFTHASRTWDTAHYEVRLAGQLRWKEGPLEGFFDLDIFGYRTRFNRIVGASRYKNSGVKCTAKNKLRLQEMAHFIAERWATLNPEDPLVQEVRFKGAS